MLGLVMFGMGLTLDPYDFKIVFTRPKDILIGSLAQFTIMPFIAYILAKIFGLDDGILYYKYLDIKKFSESPLVSRFL